MSPTSASICSRDIWSSAWQVDEVEQPLVKLDLQLGVLVALVESAGVADRDQPVLVERVRALLVGERRGVGRLADLPHRLALQPKAAATPASSVSRSLPSADLRLISSIGTPRSIAARITAWSLAMV